MKNLVLIIFFLIPGTCLMADRPVLAGLKHLTRGKYNFHYNKNFNEYSLKYIIKQTIKNDNDFNKKFSCTNKNFMDIYLYNDMIKFINDQKGMWWQKYIIKPNLAAINNIELLLQKNLLQMYLKYIIYRNCFLNTIQGRIPIWLINGLAIYYSDENIFVNRNLFFTTFDQFISKLDNFTTMEECEQANYICFKGVKYLIDNFGEDKVLRFFQIVIVKDEKEFEKQFNIFFMMTYKDFTSRSINLR